MHMLLTFGYAGWEADIRALSFAVVLIACACLPMGCKDRTSRTSEVVFAVGGAPSEIRVWEEIAGGFARDTGIAVRILRQPTDTSQRRQGLLVPLNSAQSNPDVFLMDIAWLGLFAESDWLRPLRNVDISPFYENIVRRVDMVDGRLMALPIYLDVGVLYYRTDLLEENPPQTWDDLGARALQVQKRMRRDDPGFFGFVWQGAQYEGLVVNFLDFAGQEGGFVFENDRIIVHTAPNVQALSRMFAFIHTLRISPPNTFTEMQEEEVRLFFQSANALFARNWPYAYALHQSDASPIRGKVGVAKLPAPSGGKSASTLGGWHVGVSAFSDAGERAERFAVYLASAPVQKKIALAMGLPPGRRELYDDEEILKAYPHYEQLKAILETARPRPVVPHYTQVSEIMQRRISGALAGDYAPGDALKMAQREIDALVRRYR